MWGSVAWEVLHDASDEFGIIPDMDDIGDVAIGWNNDDDRWTAATANLIEISHEGDPEVLKNRKDAALRLGVDVEAEVESGHDLQYTNDESEGGGYVSRREMICNHHFYPYYIIHKPPYGSFQG